MKIDIIASTKPGYIVDKNELDLFCGKVGGVCYMPNSFEELMNEPQEKTERRITQTMGGGHHSVYEHGYFTFHLENIPKLFAMILNNENVYVTSEKSARYTKMVCTEKEQLLYDKWLPIFEKRIREKYPDNNNFITDSRVKKLSQENARYLISVLTPTTMVYTISYRQLNYLCKWFQDEIDNPKTKYYLLINTFKEFIETIKMQNLLDERLQNDGKFRYLSLYGNRTRNEVFDEVYSTNYKTSFASLAQAQRHRTLKYEIEKENRGEFYVPKIIESSSSLADEWQTDLYSIKDNLPQGTLLSVNERGTLDNFILKCKERLCTFAQLEIDDQTRKTLKKYFENASTAEIKEYLKVYQNGSRCTFPDFKCGSQCGFSDGIKGEREI